LASHNYYYFIATLPHLYYGENPPVSSRDFIEQCGNFLSEEDAELLRYCTYDPRFAVENQESTGSHFIDFFLQRERALILSLVSLRAASLKRSLQGEAPHDMMPRSESIAKVVFDMDNPLEAELTLDRDRWSFLEDTIGVDLFSVDNAYAYLLKLQLLERKQRFNEQKGFAEYRTIYETILSEFNSRA
jgi:hypothetical protein